MENNFDSFFVEAEESQHSKDINDFIKQFGLDNVDILEINPDNCFGETESQPPSNLNEFNTVEWMLEDHDNSANEFQQQSLADIDLHDLKQDEPENSSTRMKMPLPSMPPNSEIFNLYNWVDKDQENLYFEDIPPPEEQTESRELNEPRSTHTYSQSPLRSKSQRYTYENQVANPEFEMEVEKHGQRTGNMTLDGRGNSLGRQIQCTSVGFEVPEPSTSSFDTVDQPAAQLDRHTAPEDIASSSADGCTVTASAGLTPQSRACNSDNLTEQSDPPHHVNPGFSNNAPTSSSKHGYLLNNDLIIAGRNHLQQTFGSSLLPPGGAQGSADSDKLSPEVKNWLEDKVARERSAQEKGKTSSTPQSSATLQSSTTPKSNSPPTANSNSNSNHYAAYDPFTMANDIDNLNPEQRKAHDDLASETFALLFNTHETYVPPSTGHGATMRFDREGRRAISAADWPNYDPDYGKHFDDMAFDDEADDNMQVQTAAMSFNGFSDFDAEMANFDFDAEIAKFEWQPTQDGTAAAASSTIASVTDLDISSEVRSFKRARRQKNNTATDTPMDKDLSKMVHDAVERSPALPASSLTTKTKPLMHQESKFSVSAAIAAQSLKNLDIAFAPKEIINNAPHASTGLSLRNTKNDSLKLTANLTDEDEVDLVIYRNETAKEMGSRSSSMLGGAKAQMKQEMNQSEQKVQQGRKPTPLKSMYAGKGSTDSSFRMRMVRKTSYILILFWKEDSHKLLDTNLTARQGIQQRESEFALPPTAASDWSWGTPAKPLSDPLMPKIESFLTGPVNLYPLMRGSQNPSQHNKSSLAGGYNSGIMKSLTSPEHLEAQGFNADTYESPSSGEDAKVTGVPGYDDGSPTGGRKREDGEEADGLPTKIRKLSKK
jgi:hypothetical protein